VFKLALLPFRFKAGGDGSMTYTADLHHHRNTTKLCHKPFKPRYTSKSALKDRSKGIYGS